MNSVGAVRRRDGAEGDGNNNTKAPKEGEGAHGWECFFSTGQGGIQRGPSPSEIRVRAGQKRSDCSPDGPLASGCRSSRQSRSISPLSCAAGRGVVLAGELRLTAQMPHTIRRSERRLPPRLRPSDHRRDVSTCRAASYLRYAINSRSLRRASPARPAERAAPRFSPSAHPSLPPPLSLGLAP